MGFVFFEARTGKLEKLELPWAQRSNQFHIIHFNPVQFVTSKAWQFSPSFLEQLFQISQRPEPIASVRQSLLSALPGLVRCSARSELTEEHPLRQVLRQGLQDVNGGVRTAAAQALGAMASRFELDAVQWLIPLAADPTGGMASDGARTDAVRCAVRCGGASENGPKAS